VRLFVGKKNGNDLLRNEQNALNIKIDALKIKLDALLIEFHALDTKVETMSSQLAEQLTIVPTLPTISQVGVEASPWRDNSEGQCKEDDTWPKPDIEVHFAQQDTWTRPATVNDEMSVAAAISERIREDTWTR